MENYSAQPIIVFGEVWFPKWRLFLLQIRVPPEVVKIRAHVAVSIPEHNGLGASRATSGRHERLEDWAGSLSELLERLEDWGGSLIS